MSRLDRISETRSYKELPQRELPKGLLGAVGLLSVVILLSFQVLVYLTHSTFIDFLHSSDATVPYYVYKQVFLGSSSPDDIYMFHGRAALSLPYLIYFAAAAVTSNFYFAQLANALIQTISFLAAAFYILWLTHRLRRAAFLFPLVVLMLVIAIASLPATSGEIAYRGSYDIDIKGVLYTIWMPDYHFVQISILSLLSFGIFVHYHRAGDRTKGVWLLAAFLCVAVMGSTNNLFLIYAIVPTALTAAFLRATHQTGNRDTLIWIAACLVATSLHQIVGAKLTVLGDMSYQPSFHLSSVRENLARVGWMYLANLKLQPVLIATFLLMIGVSIRSLWEQLRGRAAAHAPSAERMLLTLFMFSVGCVISVLLMSSMVRERYASGLFFVSLVLLVAVFGKFAFKLSTRVRSGVLGATILVSLSIAAPFTTKELHLSYYPHEYECVDRVLSERGFYRGIAPYNVAHRLEMTSKAGLTVAPTRNIYIYRLYVSKQDLRGPFNFIVSSGAKGAHDHYFARPADIRKHYGSPTATERCGDLTVYLFEQAFGGVDKIEP